MHHAASERTNLPRIGCPWPWFSRTAASSLQSYAILRGQRHSRPATLNSHWCLASPSGRDHDPWAGGSDSLLAAQDERDQPVGYLRRVAETTRTDAIERRNIGAFCTSKFRTAHASPRGLPITLGNRGFGECRCIWDKKKSDGQCRKHRPHCSTTFGCERREAVQARVRKGPAVGDSGQPRPFFQFQEILALSAIPQTAVPYSCQSRCRPCR